MHIWIAKEVRKRNLKLNGYNSLPRIGGYPVGFASLSRCPLKKMRSRFELSGFFNSKSSGATTAVLLFLINDMPLPDKFTVSGTPEQISMQLPILQAMYLGFKELEGKAGGSTSRPLPTDVKGHCYLKLYFVGTITGTKKTHRVEKSFRLMKDDPRTMTLERLKYLAQTVWSKFNTFTFTTGHDSWCYNDPVNGFNRIWGYFNSQSDAQRLFEQMLDIINVSPKWHCLSKSSIPIPGDRFSTLPDKVQQAGVLIRPDQERPIAVMKFDQAGIKFPHLRSETELVTKSGGLLNSLDFVTKYEQLNLF